MKHENKRSETACIVLTRYFVYGPGCSYFDENVVANTVGVLSMIAVSTTKNNVIVQRNIKQNPIFIPVDCWPPQVSMASRALEARRR